MFAALLPGLRDLRAPLASGYLWLGWIWLCFGAQLHDAASSRRSLVTLINDTSALGTTRLLAIATFAAFLIGAVLNVSSRRLMQLIIQYWDPKWESGRRRLRAAVRRGPAGDAGSRTTGLPVSPIAHRHLLSFLQRQPGGPAVEKSGSDLDDSRFRHDTKPIYDEIPQLAIRLATDQPALFDAYDRAHAEADFRGTVSVPLAFLGVTLLWVWWPPAILLLVGAPFMISAAAAKEREANDVVIEAVCIGAVRSEAVSALVGNSRSPMRSPIRAPARTRIRW